MKDRPLIFSASIGHGHHQAAKAVSLELEKKGYYPRIVDTFNSLSPLLHQVILKSYLNLLKISPSVWRKIYFQSEKNPYFLFIDRFSTMFTQRLYDLVSAHHVPFIISTHPFVTPFLTTMKKKKNVSIPLYNVITDFVLHPAYLREEVDRYFTADPSLYLFAKENNYPVEHFSMTGIPVPKHPAFYASKKESRRFLQLEEDRKIILIAGGGFGLAKYEKILQTVEMMNENLHILCMTGTNEKATKSLLSFKSKHRMDVIPFTEHFLHFLRASDVVISKSGGLTMSEALICETPIIIYKPVPGHEEHNAMFLVEKGAAQKVQTDEELPMILSNILFETELKEQMLLSAKKMKQPSAAENIVNEIIMSMEEKQRA